MSPLFRVSVSGHGQNSSPGRLPGGTLQIPKCMSYNTNKLPMWTGYVNEMLRAPDQINSNNIFQTAAC